jgi:hypothetical protein
MNTSKEFCFCTLAVGKRYREHAKMLAQDIQIHMPSTNLCILTDHPEDFQKFSHVLAFKHHLQSVKGYHDKRFVLETSLSLFESCMFLDSDVRILGSAVEEMDWFPGLTARAGCSLIKHMRTNIKDQREIELIKLAAKKLNIDLHLVQWLHEFMFVVKKQDGLEKRFFDFWQTISYFFEMQGMYHGEGYAMGLAAARVGMTFDFFRQDKFPFFKNNIEEARIKNGQVDLQEKQLYFDIHKQIEYPQRTIWEKINDKLTTQAIFYYRSLRLRKLVKKDPNFHKIFQ